MNKKILKGVIEVHVDEELLNDIKAVHGNDAKRALIELLNISLENDLREKEITRDIEEGFEPSKSLEMTILPNKENYNVSKWDLQKFYEVSKNYSGILEMDFGLNGWTNFAEKLDAIENKENLYVIEAPTGMFEGNTLTVMSKVARDNDTIFNEITDILDNGKKVFVMAYNEIPYTEIAENFKVTGNLSNKHRIRYAVL